eukprot:scpid105021/ scgid8796/ 
MWRVLGRLGVPSKLVSIIRSFLDDMLASIRIDGNLLDPISVGTGLRQGCAMAPVLFNLYMGAVVDRWHVMIADYEEIGIDISQLRVNRFFNTRLREVTRVRITECQFAETQHCLPTRMLELSGHSLPSRQSRAHLARPSTQQ